MKPPLVHSIGHSAQEIYKNLGILEKLIITLS